jgi:hypothetical protein
MSEKIYALLLRLYPAQFRARYGEESLRLFRDRLHDETGFLAHLRLCFDLIRDLAVSLPREHRALRPAMAATSRVALPSFGILQPQPPRPASIVLAFGLSLAGAGAFFTLLNYAGTSHTSRISIAEKSARAQASARQSSSTPVASSATGAPFPVDTKTGEAAVFANGAPAVTPQPNPQQGAAPSTIELAPGPPLDPAERHRVVEAAAQNLRDHYFDTTLAQESADTLLAHERSGADNRATTGESLAALLTEQIRAITHDSHVEIVYSRTLLPPSPGPPPTAAPESYRQAMLRQNCTIEKAAILPHNIGYLKLNSFPDASICTAPITGAMASINHANAVIFDLRDNAGGYPQMVSLVASYLFDHPEYMYSPRESPTAESFTRPVPGSLLADKPAYILTSSSTWSGAEQFSYDLKMLHRATLIGETTRGGAHAGVFHRIDDHFGMGIPEQRAVNPYSDHDWEGVGVEPDVKVKAADAVTTAIQLAQSKSRSH